MAKDKGKKKNKKNKDKQQLDEVKTVSAPVSAEQSAEAAPPKISRKEFEKEMEKLQVELVKMQEWVKVSGAKVRHLDKSFQCISLYRRQAALRHSLPTSVYHPIFQDNSGIFQHNFSLHQSYQHKCSAKQRNTN